MSRTVALVGGRGFIGRAVSPVLAQAGWEVLVATSGRPLPDPGGDGTPPLEAIVHLASTVNPPIAERDPEQARHDVAILRAVLDRAAAEGNPELRFVLPSSGGTVYDPSIPPPYRESSPTRPTSTYGRTKLEMEDITLDAAAQGVCVASILRLSNLYGPGQPVGTGQGVVVNWLHAAATGREAVLFGDPSATRDYLYIDDAARAILMALDAPSLPPVLNVGAGRPTSLEELADAVEGTVGTDFRVRRQAERDFDVAHNHLDVTAAAQHLGWRPAVTLTEGLDLTWRHVRATTGV